MFSGSLSSPPSLSTVESAESDPHETGKGPTLYWGDVEEAGE